MKNLSKRTITYRPLEGLTIHPAIADDPHLDSKDPRYIAMRTAWRESGVIAPIHVTPEGKIVDGRHRYWYAQDEGWEEIPCIEVSEAEVPLVIIQGLIGKNHVTKGQRAFLAAPKLESAFQAAVERRVQILQSGGKSKLPVVPSVEDMAERLGIGRELLGQARRIHAAFAEPKVGKLLKKEWEKRILDPEEPMGLGAVLQGIGGAMATKGKPKKPARNSALNNFLAGWKNLTAPAKHWAKWTEVDRDMVVDGIRTNLAKLPDEVLDAVAAGIRHVRKAKSAAAKAAESEA
ncbi:MAG: ParB N-terminal domain-containing protein [Verrucomicrobia bacterium]|nr:ParB N-terminal domain-containing protein [Verrucomicrobiota bacterium]